MTTAQQLGRYVWMPDGWQAVPKEPIGEMKNLYGVFYYQALIASAPSPPEAPIPRMPRALHGLVSNTAADAKACVAYFDNEADCAAFMAWITSLAFSTAPPEASTGAMRCLVTGNPFGTDTWQAGQSCGCAVCKAMLAPPEAPADYWLTDEQINEMKRRYDAYAAVSDREGKGEKEYTDFCFGALTAVPKLIAEIQSRRVASPPQPKLPSEEEIARVLKKLLGNTDDESVKMRFGSNYADMAGELLALLAPSPTNGDRP